MFHTLMENYKKNISLLLNKLETKKIFKSIHMIDMFYDEPKFILYSASLENVTKTYSDGKIYKNIIASGVSFTSKYPALLKCLSEAVELFCLGCYRQQSVLFSSYKDLKRYALDLSLFDKGILLAKKPLGWINGFDLKQNRRCLIPAQLVYLNHKRRRGETMLPYPIVSTGAAAGFNHEATLLHGIYEVIERDAFITTYLNKIKAQKLDIAHIKDRRIQSLLKSCVRYKLELYVFNVTNDIPIPSFLSILIDRTGFGPAVSCGLKGSLDKYEALAGSIGESFLIRTLLREELLKISQRVPRINPVKLDTALKRGLFWSSPKMLKHLNFLLNQKAAPMILSSFRGNKQEELLQVKELLTKKGIQIFYADITHSIFKEMGYLVYKVIIPGLQPLYLNEKGMYNSLRLTRLKEVAGFFGKKRFSINKIPHPFL